MRSDQIQREWENFSYNIAWLRRQHRLTKKRIAEDLGIGTKTLSRIENGELPPRLSADIFFRVYHIFGIHPRDQLIQRLGE